MDLKPNTNTLVINYSVTFGLLFLILFLSIKNPGKYYYSPEFTSPQGYENPVGCNACHVKHWSKFSEKTCWTAGCHLLFDPEQKPKDFIRITKDDFQKAKPNFGAMLAFHDQLKGMKCAQCHPSHKLPTKGLLNNTVIGAALTKELERMADKSPQAQQKKKSEIFHREAARYTGPKDCAACHVGNMQQPQQHGGAGQRNSEQAAKPATTEGESIPALPVEAPNAAATPQSAGKAEKVSESAKDMPNLLTVLKKK